MAYTMTKAEALRIQAEHVAHYAGIYGAGVIAVVADATRADELPDGEHPVYIVNRYIPRGGAIEALIGAS